MPTTYNLAPIPFWNLLDQFGDEAANGTIETFRDTARSVHKPVYQDIAGAHPFTDPIHLDGNGSVRKPMYWASDENYYVVIKDSGGNILETIEHYNSPDQGGSSPITKIESERNYVIDGQFLFNEGTITNDKFVASTAIKVAEPNWEFIKNNITANDQIKFTKFNLGETTPVATPIYYAELDCSGAGTGEIQKDFRFKIPDVRTFEGLEVSFSIAAKAVPASTFEARFIQHFGTGGSPSADVDTLLKSISATGSWATYTGTITVPSVGSKTLGTNGDDAIYITVRMPLDAAVVVDFTNVKLQIGNTSTAYQVESSNLTQMRTMGSQVPVPNPDGSDNYKFIESTPTGLQYSNIMSGMTFAWCGLKAGIPKHVLLCDGSKYRTSEKTSDNIPYQLLFTAIGNIWGTGDDYCYSYANSDVLQIANNARGAVTATADGATPTNFTFSTISTGSATGYDVKPFPQYGAGTLVLDYDEFAGYTASAVGTSGFTVTHIVPQSLYVPGTDYWTMLAATTLAGKYWTFQATAPVSHYVWYTVAGAGSDPAVPGHTGILVALDTGDTADEVAVKTAAALLSAENSKIVCTAASAITAASYFTFDTTGESCYVWYRKDQVGSDPSLAGKVGIVVDISSTDTATDVGTKTQTAINTEFFAVPDFRGRVLSGIDDSVGLDDKVLYRYSKNPTVYGDNVGTFQRDYAQAHVHDVDPPDDFMTDVATGTGDSKFESGGEGMTTLSGVTSTPWGNGRNTVLNAGVYWVIGL